jgi:hypothetical protein
MSKRNTNLIARGGSMVDKKYADVCECGHERIGHCGAVANTSCLQATGSDQHGYFNTWCQCAAFAAVQS